MKKLLIFLLALFSYCNSIENKNSDNIVIGKNIHVGDNYHKYQVKVFNKNIYQVVTVSQTEKSVKVDRLFQLANENRKGPFLDQLREIVGEIQSDSGVQRLSTVFKMLDVSFDFNRMIRKNSEFAWYRDSTIKYASNFFSGMDLSGFVDDRASYYDGAANFNGIEFRHVDFSNCALKKIEFKFSQFDSCNFSKADLAYTNLSYANFASCNFFESNFAFANLSGVKFRKEVGMESAYGLYDAKFSFSTSTSDPESFLGKVIHHQLYKKDIELKRGGMFYSNDFMGKQFGLIFENRLYAPSTSTIIDMTLEVGPHFYAPNTRLQNHPLAGVDSNTFTSRLEKTHAIYSSLGVNMGVPINSSYEILLKGQFEILVLSLGKETFRYRSNIDSTSIETFGYQNFFNERRWTGSLEFAKTFTKGLSWVPVPLAFGPQAEISRQGIRNFMGMIAIGIGDVQLKFSNIQFSDPLNQYKIAVISIWRN